MTTPAQHPTPSNRDVFSMAWPLCLKTMMLQGIVAIDAYLISPLGEEALAAVGLAGALGGLLLGILFAFSNATQIRIAQAFGSAGPVELKTGFYCGLLINLISTGIGLIAVLAFAAPAIAGFAQTEWIEAQANAYLSVFLFVILAEAVGQTLSSHFNGCGRTKVSFVSYLIALPVNILASIGLIHGQFGLPELGVLGAAYGTIIAAVLRVAFMGWIFWRDHRWFRDVAGWSRGSFGNALKRHFAFSWPIAITFVSTAFSNQACMLIYATMSVNQFAAMTLILPWVNVLGTFGMSWAQATGISVAQLIGRGATVAQLDAFLSRAWRAAFIASALVSLWYLGFCLSSGVIYAALQDETKQALMSFLPILLVLPFPKQSNAICGQTLRAAGETVPVMNIFIAGQWGFKVPMTALFVLYLDMPVFWVFALVLGDELFRFPLFHKRLYRGDWKHASSAI
ncbi:polysaccharide biosynthesis C-terminal domain-containing protein [Alphaproteobacteria bacterium KMM 3653]|uniref:Polysaccharide biosynthesis C-terminal domain-containing protein n=1 Tax=Harenicola maris TaxID=2841044 RepID=A0AAP2CPS6_9RHOB|nr:polysaccharide biosynthesis C-terminal domain-containing protein [Harenicola maris]